MAEVITTAGPNILGRGDGTNSYIVDLETRDTLHFIHVAQDITDTAAPNYNAVDIIGSSSPIQGYANTGARSINLDLQFSASIMGNDIPQRTAPVTASIPEQNAFIRVDGQEVLAAMRGVFYQVNFLRSLIYPVYNQDFTMPPPMVFLSIASFLKICGIVTDCSVTWQKPYTIAGWPMMAEVSLTITQVHTKPPGRDDVRAGRDMPMQRIGGLYR